MYLINIVNLSKLEIPGAVTDKTLNKTVLWMECLRIQLGTILVQKCDYTKSRVNL